MASRENSKAYSQAASGLTTIDEDLKRRVLESLPWDEAPFSSLKTESQDLLQNRAEVSRYVLGEKIWSKDIRGSQYFIVTGKVRLREEETSKPIATLEPGDWFGELLLFSVDCKAIAASKEVMVVSWDVDVWTQVSTSEVVAFWEGSTENDSSSATNAGSKTQVLSELADVLGDSQTENQEEQLDNVDRDASYRSDFSPSSSLSSQKPQFQKEFLATAAPQTSTGYPFVAGWNTGAACLTMVSQYLQNPAQLEWVQRQLRGQRPKNMVEAAEKVGFILRKLNLTWVELRQLTFPAVMRWGGTQDKEAGWVVAYGIKGDRLIIANPLNKEGKCESIPRQMAEECWDGNLWQAELVNQQEKFNLSWFLPAVWRYKGLLTEVLIASFTLQLLGLTTPLITQVVIDKVMVQESLPTLDVMAIALLSVASFESILGILRLFIFTHTARRLDLSLSAQLFRHLMRLPLAYFESRRVGDTVARVQELEQIRQFLTGTALTVVLDSIFAVVYLALMSYYSIPLTFAGLAVLPLFAILTLVATPILRNWLNETFNRSADSQSFLVETITAIHSVKAHAAEPVARDRWEGLFARFVRTGFKASTTQNISSNIGDFLTNLSSLLILWFGAKLVIEQKLTVGQLVAFQMLAGRVTGPLLRLVQLWQNLQQVLLSVDRIGDILNVAPEAEPGTGLVLPPLKGQVSFEQVFFRYKANTEPILRGISLDVEPGQFIGIVGRSGSGKSTLSKLLQRLYTIESGRILIDGFDIKSADLASLRQQIGVVLQEDFLFNSSILENITLGNPDITAEEVVEAARMAVAHDFISQLPNGYETNAGERGTALSGGQRQRIALARLFLCNAPILILDEATSALDAETEQQVLQNLQKVSQGRTVFIIAHRFAPLKRADQILVMERGVLAERGTHDSLLREKGLYWSLYQRQQANV
ncbi:peptidase domain-containing ABC transporter [Brunnivagina elsteri]|uniref:Type I secretion system permease/ATPase n=1 Tax=Brunnivagina elsteri CCALA 953 TaxID=987040 RepID=A0A2A2TEV1_9CYAN|nr:peptidase domain-containing ABC transporter [Calothrix elsteri]PAX52196.1 type I secretion system permease/ATPase [Calothrix elsteri CCALA 953]